MKIKNSFVEIFEEIIKDDYKNDYRSRKRNESEYFKEIIKVIYSSPYWSRYNSHISNKLLNKKHNEYIKKGYYKKIYEVILKNYIKLSKYSRFKHISTDTCFIPNKYCSGLMRNKFYKSKKGLKISSINDANGIPLSIIVVNGNVNDAKILKNTYERSVIKTNPQKYKNSNRHKQHFLADKGYDSKNNRKYLKEKGFNTIIPYNTRNTKDPKKINKLTDKEKQIYKKRIVVENYYSWIKQFSKINFVYESNMTNFLNLVYLASAVIISNRNRI